MNIEILTAAAIGFILLIFVVTSSIRKRKMIGELRNLLEFSQNQINELQDTIVRSREANDTVNKRTSDQARRIAWLESRLRKPLQNSDEVLNDNILTETSKLSMTERRHRVVTLASRGKSADSIAASLGLFKGEVELILRLNQAATGAR